MSINVRKLASNLKSSLLRKAFQTASQPLQDIKLPPQADATNTTPETAKLILGKGGLFFNVNLVVLASFFAVRDGYDFELSWPSSPYRDSDQPGNPFYNYFESPFVSPSKSAPVFQLPTRNQLFLSPDNPVTPRWFVGRQRILTPTRERALCSLLAQKYIRLLPQTQTAVDEFHKTNFDGPTIGVHIRGPGRDHGGADVQRLMLQPDGGIPYWAYFKGVVDALATHPNARIFVCSDAQQAIDRFTKQYGDKVFTYPSTRTEFGEVHERHPNNGNFKFSPYKIGLDVVVEAHLLARCDHYVHGNSNVANYVLVRNADMPATYAYAATMPALNALAHENIGRLSVPNPETHASSGQWRATALAY